VCTHVTSCCAHCWLDAKRACHHLRSHHRCSSRSRRLNRAALRRGLRPHRRHYEPPNRMDCAARFAVTKSVRSRYPDACDFEAVLVMTASDLVRSSPVADTQRVANSIEPPVESIASDAGRSGKTPPNCARGCFARSHAGNLSPTGTGLWRRVRSNVGQRVRHRGPSK
jgi:hypothetical protein